MSTALLGGSSCGPIYVPAGTRSSGGLCACQLKQKRFEGHRRQIMFEATQDSEEALWPSSHEPGSKT